MAVNEQDDLAEAIVAVLEGNLAKLERGAAAGGYALALSDVRDVVANMPVPPEEPPARDVAGAIIEDLDDLLADLQEGAGAQPFRGSAARFVDGVRAALDAALAVRNKAVRP